jgi:hypothetical protein
MLEFGNMFLRTGRPIPLQPIFKCKINTFSSEKCCEFAVVHEPRGRRHTPMGNTLHRIAEEIFKVPLRKKKKLY